MEFKLNFLKTNIKSKHSRRTFTPESQARYGHRNVTTSKNKEKDTPVKYGYHLEDYERQCVYLHYYDDSEVPFYVGQGTLQRAFVLKGTRRNDEYNAIAEDINKIRVEIVAIDVTPEEGVELEGQLIAKYKFISDGGSLVNVVSKGRGGIQNPEKMIAVCQFTMSGDYIKTFKSMKDACRETGGDTKSIRKCCLNPMFMFSCKKFRWRFAKDCEDIVSQQSKDC